MRTSRTLALLAMAALLPAGASCTSLLGDYNQGNGPAGGDGGAIDSSLDGTTSEAGDSGTTVDSGGGDGSGGSDTGAGGGGEGGQEAGSPLNCTFVASGQRSLTGGDAGTISADNLYVYAASQTNVLALVKTGSPPGLAYSFRSDRPGDPPNVVQLGNNGAPAHFMSSTRSVANDATYVLGSDQNNELLLWNWPDSANITATPTNVATTTVQFGTSKIVAATSGVFYANAVQSPTQGVYVDFEMPVAPPVVVSGDQISTMDDTGLTDGDRTYVLSDGSVSVVYYGSDGTLHQNIYEPGGLTMKSSRQYFTGQMLPISFLADGTNVDIAAVEAIDDGGALGFFSGVVPESQIGTFDPTTSLKPLSAFTISGPNACLAAYPGYILALIPTTSGMDLYVIDVATASVAYSLTGASNILHGDTEIVACGLSTAGSVGNTLSFNLIWTENAGSGTQNLEYAPLQCTQ